MPKATVWNRPSPYGTYEGPRGNPTDWQAGLNNVWETSEAVRHLIGTTAYTILGLRPPVTEAEIKRAYRKLALQHHTDHGGDATTFNTVTQAYTHLMRGYRRLPEDPVIRVRTTQAEVAPAPIVVPPTQTTQADVVLPQLLTEICEDELQRFLDDDSFGAQEKKDGRHLTLQVAGVNFYVRNKKGVASTFGPEFEGSLRNVGFDLLIDGEQIGSKFYAWDILEFNGQSVRDLPYYSTTETCRYSILKHLDFGPAIVVLGIAFRRDAKLALFNHLKSTGKEGIVFKKLAATYTEGRGEDQYKFKFWGSVSVIVVAGRPGKASIGMELIGTNGREFVGYCTCCMHPLPAPGSVAEIKYLYAYHGGCLYQPSFKELRDDVDPEECLMGQLKYKSVEE